jgi:hypothetical protein
VQLIFNFQNSPAEIRSLTGTLYCKLCKALVSVGHITRAPFLLFRKLSL